MSLPTPYFEEDGITEVCWRCEELTQLDHDEEDALEP